MTEPQPTKLFSTGLIYSCLAWTPIPLAMALAWDATRKGTGLWQMNLDEFLWACWIGIIGFFMALAGLHLALVDTDLHDQDAPGHPYAVFGALANAAVLVVAVVVFVIVIGRSSS